jgi:hypothetical protein
MTDVQLYKRLQNLKPSLKIEVFDFVDFLLAKQCKEIESNKPQFGCAKGRFKMSPDFDAPLDDLKEYMF